MRVEQILLQPDQLIVQKFNFITEYLQFLKWMFIFACYIVISLRYTSSNLKAVQDCTPIPLVSLI